MRYRTFGRTGWQVSEIGYGTWGMAEWSGSDDAESLASLELTVAKGVNFFDTARSYGDGRSERLLALLLAGHRGTGIFTATKVPPMNREWPSRPGVPLGEVFPSAYIRESVDASRSNLGVDVIDLLQLHVWDDAWLAGGEVARTVAELKREGSIWAFGVSLNRGQPWSGVEAVRTGFVDAVQVVYNVFDQAAEDELFRTCRENGVAVIARCPFDEGSLIGDLTLGSTWPAEDWRSRYFGPENLAQSVARADALKPLLPPGMTLADLALRFILSNPDVSTVIPGMRRAGHVESNTAAGDAGPLPPELLAELQRHRWDRQRRE
ncbi:MAG: aldo/keto reductase [Candidatus Limnocylindrales bacterium]|jgi:aryl-alcohol dehydrogenase-like predicted oxidoreductase